MTLDPHDPTSNRPARGCAGFYYMTGGMVLVGVRAQLPDLHTTELLAIVDAFMETSDHDLRVVPAADLSTLREGDGGTHTIDLAIGMKLCTANCMSAFEPVDTERRRFLTGKASKLLPQVTTDLLAAVPRYLDRSGDVADAIRRDLSEAPQTLLAGFGPRFAAEVLHGSPRTPNVGPYHSGFDTAVSRGLDGRAGDGEVHGIRIGRVSHDGERIVPLELVGEAHEARLERLSGKASADYWAVAQATE